MKKRMYIGVTIFIVLVVLVLLLSAQKSDEEYIRDTDWSKYFVHAASNKLYMPDEAAEGDEQIVSYTYYYKNEDYSLFGDEVNSVITALQKRFPDELTYATDGTDYQRYYPNETGAFHKDLTWVTAENELIELTLKRSEQYDGMLMVELLWSRNALKEIVAEVVEKDGNYLWVTGVSETAPEKPYLIRWDSDDRTIISQEDVEEYAPGDFLNLWFLDEHNDLTQTENEILRIKKMEKVEMQ